MPENVQASQASHHYIPHPHLSFHHTNPIESQIDELCSERYSETSYDGLGELSDLVEQTKGSPSVVAKAIRHHLEGDSVHAQKRALTIIEGLVEMGTPEFQRKFAEPTLVHAFQNTAENFGTDNGVRRKLMLMLLSWHRHFMRDPTMAHVSSLYGLCGGVDRVPVMPNQAKVIKPLHEHESTVDLLDDDSERVSVAGAISLASSESQALLQAMVNAREVHTNVLANEQVRVHVSNVLNSQKQLVRFIHTVNDEHYLGSLVQANDKIVDVLQRLQMAAAGGPIATHALGTEAPDRSDIITQASQRLTSISESEPTVWSNLSREVDHSLMVHSGFTSAAPSRPGLEAPERADGTEIDMAAAAHNTKQVNM